MKKDRLYNALGKLSLHGFITALLLVTLLFVTIAQPSGGPFGPIQQTYELPKVTGKIYYVAPDGKTESKGDQLTVPTTIENAIANASTGDAIIIRGGIYRTGDLEFNQGITIQPFANEQPILKGTYEAKDWKAISGGLWKIKWEHFFPESPDGWWTRDRFGMETPLHIFNNDMVFVDGKILKSTGWAGEVDEQSFYIDYKSGFVYIGTNPANHLVEITAHNFGLHRVTKDVHGRKNDHKDPDLCEKLNQSPLKQYDYNVFVRDVNNGFKTLVYWSPAVAEGCQQAVESLDGLKKVFDGASVNSRVYEGFNMPMFKSPELGNFQLNKAFPGATAAVALPVEIQNLLGLPAKYKPYTGAYPVK